MGLPRGLLVVMWVVGCTAQGGGSPAVDSGMDATAVDTGTLPDGAGDVGADDSGHDGRAVGDSGPADAGALDTGAPDTGLPDTGLPDTGLPDTGPPDTGPPDTGPPDTGPAGPRYLLSNPGQDCNTACGGAGLSCVGSGTVALNCGMHAGKPNCTTSGFWIYRDHPTMPPPHCTNSWGTSDVCSNNYNVYNSFCCACR